jgi:hypothetical protein
MESVMVNCPFCAIQTVAYRMKIRSEYIFECMQCHKCWSEPSHSLNLFHNGENGYIKPRGVK